MNRKRSYIAGLILLTCSLSACEKEIDVKVPGYKSKLVINSSTHSGDTIRVFVGKSIGILEYNRNKDLNIDQANVLLYRSGSSEADTLRYEPHSGSYLSRTTAEAGEIYSIKVAAAGFADATAVSAVPQHVPILSVQRLPQARVNTDGIVQDELRITFKDPPAKGDFYILHLYKVRTDSSYYSDCINTPDASVESIYDETIDQNTCLDAEAIFIRDDLFNGSTKELRLFASREYLSPETSGGNVYKVELVLQHVTEDYFRFQKTYRFASENNDNPFAEPTNIHTNISNGYGIFGIIGSDTRDVD